MGRSISGGLLHVFPLRIETKKRKKFKGVKGLQNSIVFDQDRQSYFQNQNIESESIYFNAKVLF